MGGEHDLNHQRTRIVGIRARARARIRARIRARARARILPLARVCRVRLISGGAAAGRHRDAGFTRKPQSSESRKGKRK